MRLFVPRLQSLTMHAIDNGRGEKSRDVDRATEKPAQSGHMHRRDVAPEGSKLTGNHMNLYDIIRIVIVTE